MSNQAGLGLGDTVHNQEINEYPEDWKQEYLRVSDWAKHTARRFGRRVVIHIIDPQSAAGMWKLLRHGIRRYPTVILNGRTRFVGW
ncbi:MAG: hypothetical protein HY784_18945 [Chloroflexi bacterium]|nr:hypothetical protein [Chloroflexota bacterium]